eukprot:TRINITY_DN7109_c0_g1_i6.p1 TRINITY_DN7109_c0_g1~~TRINITY_DN7109_c0_g1_i6.p1  ORF type:complete len:347 (+),score=160.74 TRINITY_DN7109_c0_g1_i6:106-1146(+)
MSDTEDNVMQTESFSDDESPLAPESKEEEPQEPCPVSEEERGEDVSENKKGGVYKKILIEGSGDEHPTYGAEVKVHYTGTLLDGTKFDSSVDRNEPFTFEIGKGRVIKGWDQGVKVMKRGEKAILTIRPDFGYGKNGSGKIPPNAWLRFEVQLLDWEEPSWKLTKEQKLAKANDKKEKANNFFRQQQFQAALDLYQSGRNMLDSIYGAQGEEEKQLNQLKSVFHLNMAACCLKLRQFPKVVENCNKVLEQDPNNQKALFRRGQANIDLDEWDSARSDLQRALDLLRADPNVKEAELTTVRREQTRLNQRISTQREKERMMFGGWLNKSSAKASALETKEEETAASS